MLYKGIPAAPGIGIGTAFVINDTEFCTVKRNIAKEDIPSETERFKKALNEIRSELEKTKKKAEKLLGKKHVKLFDAYLFVIDDPMLKDDVLSKIVSDRVNAEYALHEVLNKNLKAFDKIKDEYFKERGRDILDVARRVLKYLSGAHKKKIISVPENSIVFAANLTPTDAIAIKEDGIIGFAINMGGKTSHSTIMARALEIPAVVGMNDITQHVHDGDITIIDGIEGVVIANPDKDTLENYKRRRNMFLAEREELILIRDLPSVTKDGKKVVVSANIEIPEEVKSVIAYGGEGIGLFRTEYLYLNRKGFPSEEEQYESYRSVAEKMFPNPIVIRTMDLGGDRFLSYFHLNEEKNPFLGLRAIRFCLKHPDIFKIQLRAILRASSLGNIKMMFPMISGVGELRDVKKILEETKQELKQKGVPYDEHMEVGIMIEIPSAALTVDVLAKESDFLSIGTNDLIQYTLAVDRVNEYVAQLYEPLHLSILRLLKNIIDAGKSAGKWVSMCGEMAGEPSYTEILLGLGLEHFSVAPSSLLRVKNEVRKANYSDAAKTTDEILNEADRDLLVKKVKQKRIY
ncbi:MAG: Phosphoenolpyruvate-protein phosphotransferase [Elusimicrobia bacterium ADurb.Bin231]|nr:MAG: Phosphoenolpyruvate-protein phosphotransferase [Elusimicrobia bacterium ADurb.Bin231]